MGRPWWRDDYWKKLDWRQEKKMRTVCPYCGSDKTYYNKKYKTWRCLKCEKSFFVEGLGSKKDGVRERRVSRPHRDVGRAIGIFWRYFKRFLILVWVLATAAIVVSAVCLFISGEIKLGSTVVIAGIGLIILVWGLSSFSKYRPGLTRTFMFLFISGLFIIASSVYLGIKSPADVKDSVVSALSTEEDQFRSTVDLLVERMELEVVDAASVGQEAVESTVEEISNNKNVHVDGGILIGADGHHITLRNNPDAINPSWEELKRFLLEDSTDSIPYDFDTFVCADFAEMLHNNAEASGIRAAFVCIQLGPCSYFSISGGHALNAFETVDKGLVYIDCTGCFEGINADKIVEVETGKNYVPKSIFPEPGWSAVWESMGAVEEIEVIQW